MNYATIAYERCDISIEDDFDKGGYLADCDRHGRLTTRDSIGGAEEAANRHGRKWMEIDRKQDELQIETIGAGSSYNDQCSHAVNSDCEHYS